MLKIKNLKFYYKKDSKLYDYSLEANKSQIVSIMGPSGSGKSTFLDLVAGFLTPNSGEMCWNDLNFTKLSPEKRPITILFQQYNLFEHLSVERNIAVGIDRSFSLDKSKKIVISKILEEVGLRGYEKKLCSKLSGGEQQRVALSRSLVRNRPILLLDEPFSSLDRQIRIQMLNLVKEITLKNQFCTLMITHDKEDSKLIANKQYELINGVLKHI